MDKEIFLKIDKSVTGPGFLRPNDFTETSAGNYAAVLGYCFKNEEPKTQKSFCELLGNIITKTTCDQELKELNGSYAGIVICPSSNEVHIISDRWGTRPLYYFEGEEELIVGSDFWKIVDCIKSPKFSTPAFLEMMTFAYVLGQHTVVENVYEITRASHVIIKIKDEKKIDLCGLTPLWNYDIQPEYRRPKDMTFDIANILKKVGKRQSDLLKHMGVNNIGLNLTGGFDSRVIAYMLHSNQVNFKCFTSRTIGGENDAAFRISQFLGVPHCFIPYWLEDGLAPAEQIFWESSSTAKLFTNHTISLSQYGPWPVQGFITGHYGDPVTGRQAKLSEYWLAKRGQERLTRNFVEKQIIWDTSDIRNLLKAQYKDFANCGPDSLMKICKDTVVSHPYGIVTRVDAEQRQRRYILKDYHCLCKLGVSTLPFHDYELWDCYMAIPFEWQINSVAYSNALCEHLFQGEYQELQDIPINGVRRRSIKYPMLANYQLSLSDINKKIKYRIRRKLNLMGDISPARLSVYAEKELVKLYPLLDTMFEIDAVKKLVDGKRNNYYFVVHHFWILYTIGRILGRLYDRPYEWGK